ncbi:Apyrase [Ancylostoma duodenale]|uniref:Apyrase n=1 Tax=Ancylostoma duodenale TaxID=51022 RepID=A0A0C2GHY2_9BILA|nr:Apyrase [Ancylostoma duodenale]
MLVVSDMYESQVKSANSKWYAIARKGKLTLAADNTTAKVDWVKGSEKNITAEPELYYSGEAMDLSNPVLYDGQPLYPDDKTGMVYVIWRNEAIPFVSLNSGSGNTTEGMKVKWLTIKKNRVYVGGHGAEFRNGTGDQDSTCIKTINRKGKVRSEDWTEMFSRIQWGAGYRAPYSYLTHEAVQWSETLQIWLFLPRKASQTPYVKREDETKGSNILIRGNKDLSKFITAYIGGKNVKHPDRGFAAFDFIPGTEDRLIVAIKTKEVQDSDPESYITVFGINGIVLLEDQKLEGNFKFEKIYFV